MPYVVVVDVSELVLAAPKSRPQPCFARSLHVPCQGPASRRSQVFGRVTAPIRFNHKTRAKNVFAVEECFNSYMDMLCRVLRFCGGRKVENAWLPLLPSILSPLLLSILFLFHFLYEIVLLRPPGTYLCFVLI